MGLLFFLRGVVIGLSIAAPVGPIGVLCIRRTLAAGRGVGFVSGLGAATADASYGAVAAFGLTAVSGFLIGQRVWIQGISAAFLLALGLRTLLSKPAARAAKSDATSLAGAYASVVALTLTNPATILSFVAIFAGLGLANATGAGGAAILTVLGVFLGSALWWLLLSTGVSLLRERFTPRGMRLVNVLSGALLIGFAAVILVSLFVVR